MARGRPRTSDKREEAKEASERQFDPKREVTKTMPHLAWSWLETLARQHLRELVDQGQSAEALLAAGVINDAFPKESTDA